MRCHELQDITWMSRPEPPATHTIMPCTNPAEWVEDGDIVCGRMLCSHHYDMKQYRGEDTSRYVKLTQEMIYASR